MRSTRRGILYAPDFIANAGGLISVYGELRGLAHERALELADGIEGSMLRILEAGSAESATPLEAARAPGARPADAEAQPAVAS